MDPLRLLRTELRASLHGPAWHGPALLEALQGVDAPAARARPVPGTHTIAELALHALAWTEEVLRRLEGADAAMPARGDWPVPGDWDAVVPQLVAAGDALDAALAVFPPERLLERVGGEAHDPPLGSGLPYAVMLHGLAQHNAYHGGQIVLLRRALESGAG